MIEIVTPLNRHMYGPLLEDMHRMRYSVVVERWGWEVPGAQPGYDKDAFDTPDTVYVLHLDKSRTVVQGCCRLNSTLRPNMLSELYHEACDLRPAPCNDAIWESSRFVISPNLTSRHEYFEIMWRLGVGMNEYGLAAGITHIAWYTDPAFYNTINSVMEVEPIGRPKFNEKDQETYIPAIARMDETSLAAMRQKLADPKARVTHMLAPIFSLAPDFQLEEAA